MRYTGNWLTTSLFIIGVALGAFSGYHVLTGMYRMVAWKWTEGVIIGTEAVEGIEDYSIHEKAAFVDSAGDTIQVIAFSGVTNEEDARTGDVTILYNPTNSREATILQFRDYLVVFFIPFAAFLTWIGWPFEARRDVVKSGKVR